MVQQIMTSSSQDDYKLKALIIFLKMSTLLDFIFLTIYLLNISGGECVMWTCAYQTQNHVDFSQFINIIENSFKIELMIF